MLGPETTTDEVLAGIDLRGRVALVTGASAGLGVETARALAAHGAHVVMAARDSAKLSNAIDAIRAKHPSASLEAGSVDLASLASVRAFTEAVRAKHDRIHMLIANAGVMATPLAHTADGFELQFGTNHLGHFALVNRLVPLLLRAAPSRVVIVSSYGHQMSDVDLDDPNFERTPYDKFVSYGRSKTANVLFTVALDRRLRERGVRCFTLHPGGILTELGRHMVPADLDVMKSRASNSNSYKIPFKSVAAGAATSVWGATSPDLAGKGGLYLEDCQIAPVNEESAPTGARAYAMNPERAEALWQLSERMIGERFAF
jgi:NAD(P)-dependent dehydrogenase (short-subunit alcohol dehydrogenase family)